MESACSSGALSASVLVLNRSYMAIHVVNVRRAFGLLCRSIADVIDVENHQYGCYDFEAWRELSEFRSLEPPENDQTDWIQSVNFRIAAPKVIRLHRFDRIPRKTLRFNRRNLLARDEHCCQYCGLKLPNHQLSLDHVMPRSRGGETSWENVVCSCVSCNTRKGSRTPHEARMALLRRPIKPRHSPLLALKLLNPKYEIWKTFLPSGSWSVDVS